MGILIVDDSKDSRDLLKAFLKGAGYKDITSVASAQEAFEALGMKGVDHRHAIPFKAILMDVVMPEMNGIEACRVIREDAHLVDIPVIMVTAVGGQENLNEAFEAGATDYITKPVKKVELLARVRSALRLHQEMERRKIREKELVETLEQLQRTQAQLLRTKKLASIGILSAGVAHEILNPLNIISTTAQLTMMDEPKGPIYEKMRGILDQIQRAVKIVKNLGMFASKNRMEVEDVHLHAIFDQAAGSLEQDLKANNNITVERHFDHDAPPIKGDAIQLEQVFAILISNARDAMRLRGNGTITVATWSVEHGIEFKFCDDGPGIPANILEKVFDPFFTTKDPGKGTGLGLSIAHRIIEDHGGTLSVESETGKTCFTIFLPKDAGPVAAG